MYVILEFCAEMTLQSYPALCHLIIIDWALSIQPKTSGISVRNKNGTDHFGLVRPAYLGPPSKVVHFYWSSYLGRSD